MYKDISNYFKFSCKTCLQKSDSNAYSVFFKISFPFFRFYLISRWLEDSLLDIRRLSSSHLIVIFLVATKATKLAWVALSTDIEISNTMLKLGFYINLMDKEEFESLKLNFPTK